VAETRDAALIGHEFTPDRINTPEIEELDADTERAFARHLERAGCDPGHAARGVAAALELTGLTNDERRTLRKAADTAGALFVSGDADFLAGETATLRGVADELDGESGLLGTLAGRLRGLCA
jgi:dihydropteroate synthase